MGVKQKVDTVMQEFIKERLDSSNENRALDDLLGIALQKTVLILQPEHPNQFPSIPPNKE